MSAHMKFFKTKKQEEQNPDGSFFSYPEFCIDTNPIHKAAMTVQEVYILEQAARIAELEAQNKRLVEALSQYIENFENEEISSKDLKYWLDTDWIPAAREILAAQ